MKISQIKQIARQHHIDVTNMQKRELVLAIQHAEGNPECFDSNSHTTCHQDHCLWRSDCIEAARAYQV